MSTFTVPARSARTTMDLNLTQNIVNPEWELIDPVPDIHNLFQKFNAKFFNGKLGCVELEWSKRMYQCAGICYSKKSRGHMSCIIRLSEPLLKLRSRKELIETLLHEMIHAFNFVRGILEGNGGHGQNFISKMHEINRVAGTNITVYHSFHDEVELYRKHWWRCDGVCRLQKPYFGYVKRTSNRAPGPNDFWWKQHMNTCGGKFIKVKEPEKTEKKPKESKPKKEVPAKRKVPAKKENPANDIRNFFPDLSLNSSTDETTKSPKPSTSSKAAVPVLFKSPEAGIKLGGSGSGRSRLLDMFDKMSSNSGGPNAKKPKLDDVIKPVIVPRKSIKVEVMHEFDDDDDIILIDDEYDDSFVTPKELIKSEIKTDQASCNCPICNKKVDAHEINQHLDECLTMQILPEMS